jgi:hypothetical protein
VVVVVPLRLEVTVSGIILQLPVLVDVTTTKEAAMVTGFFDKKHLHQQFLATKRVKKPELFQKNYDSSPSMLSPDTKKAIFALVTLPSKISRKLREVSLRE